MSWAATAVLGGVSGLTIMLGLPIARWGRPGPRLMAFLTSASVGVLLFIFYDVIRHASETVEVQLGTSTAAGVAFGFLVAAGLAVGLFTLVLFERVWRRRPLPAGPGAMTAVAETTRLPLAAPLRTALFIAIGIGLHNFSEGLAIGESAAAGAYRFFLVLVIGFGLHNITEGFGISGPLLGQRPSWRFLGLLGLAGGGPTLAGTLVGYAITRLGGATSVGTQAVSVLFLALAAGAIVYVIGELQHVNRKIGSQQMGMLGLLCGFLAGYGTDLLLKSLGG
ncbi:MAG: ZIP family metal transporter [Candidatus Dormibacteraeota bacterium]|uniref:ZIP family metal transporter n=1 Tax=Candidatus Amunia macphersoniae TaxID=3127014 RepID=A0A934KRG5_9BACT|nr:ZIP family metal transporter [Candidatus Dormibacteraeota bacterium]